MNVINLTDRDHNRIVCHAAKCIYNNKDHICNVPGLCIIDENAKCRGFKAKNVKNEQ